MCVKMVHLTCVKKADANFTKKELPKESPSLALTLQHIMVSKVNTVRSLV